MARDRKRLSGSGLVCWLKFVGDDDYELLAFVPDKSIGYRQLLTFFSDALEDLRRYGKPADV